VNSLPKTVTREHRGCDLNPGPSVPESSTLTTQLPSSWYTSTPGLVLILTYNDRTVTHLHIKWGAAAEPVPVPAGAQGQATACARYKDGCLAAEPLVILN